ncbi:MAG: flagellar basal body L-ring protein FlgH [Candidatus Margulisbacteria bacterium]|jgi:flagellar L-ring protein precursor FlgH|nr:flagellar basal body L-ring protein FlgH [Candidatus Margulisiibacteriota bacterium]
MNKKLLALGSLLLALTVSAGADSLWGDNSASPYSTQKGYKVGDIINIIVLESTSAKSLAGSKSDVKDDLNAKLTHTLARLAPVIGTNTQIAGSAQNKYIGDASTNRGNNVSARIAAWVTEVLPNGNLNIKGLHRVEVNDELQEISITGQIRPKDVSGGNTIYSYQVANAELAVKGTGAVADSSSPGWLTRIFNWIF